MTDIRLSADARSALRRAITNHPGWDNHRKATGLSLATMSRSDYLAAARALGIEIQGVVAAADSARANEAAVAFGAAPTYNEELARRAAVTPEQIAADRAQHNGALQSDAETRAYIEARSAETSRRNDEERNAELARAVTEAESTRPARPVTPANEDKAAQLLRLISEMSQQTVDAEQVRAIVKHELDAALLGSTATIRIELTRNDETVREIRGHKHPKFPMLLKCLTAVDASGYTPSVWLAGPAGSGKTRAASDAAKALELPFHYNGAIGMAHELVGFIDAGGTYHRTPFREAYEHGGVYLFDEVDGSDNSALLALNAALANGMASFPDGAVLRHDQCRIIAAANTWGFGGTADYVGRSKIDAAFLSRFPVRIFWDYDNNLERQISGNSDFAIRVQAARAKARQVGLKVLITPRDSIAGAGLIAAGFTPDEAAEMTYLANLSVDQKRQISD